MGLILVRVRMPEHDNERSFEGKGVFDAERMRHSLTPSREEVLQRRSI
jgi:hypothetical protein